MPGYSYTTAFLILVCYRMQMDGKLTLVMHDLCVKNKDVF